MKKLVFIVFCCILMSCPREFPVNEANEPIIIPFSLVGNNRMILYATVNGVEGRFIWDSGAFHSFTLTSLDNLTPVPRFRTFFIQVPWYYIENGIVIDGQVIETRSIISYIPSHPWHQWENWIVPYFLEHNINGVLGTAMFHGWWVEVSFSTNNIILHRTKPQGFTDFTPVRKDFRGLHWFIGFIFVPGTIDGIPVEFVVDTGAPNAFYFPHSFREKLGTVDYRTILAEHGTFYEIPTENIRVIGTTFYNKTIFTTSRVENSGRALLGMEYLQHYDLLFDMRALRGRALRNSRLYFRHRSDKAETERSFGGLRPTRPDPLGIQLVLRDGRIRVWSVVLHGFAYELGLRPGMWITAINEQRISGTDRTRLYEFFAYLKEGGNGELTILDIDGTERVIRRR